MFAVKFHSIKKTLMLRAMRLNFDKKQTNPHTFGKSANCKLIVSTLNIY